MKANTIKKPYAKLKSTTLKCNVTGVDEIVKQIKVVKTEINKLKKLGIKITFE